MNQVERLSNHALIGYGLSAAPVMYAYVLVLVMYMKYAVDGLGASPAAIGTVFLLAKLWDAISDPLVGNLSDRTVRASGRRRPWLRAAAPLLAVFCVMLWAPPARLEGAGLIAWIGVAVFGFYTAYTVFQVPHMSLGAELSLERGERNRIFGFRQLMQVLGMLAAGTLGVSMVGRSVAAAASMGYALGAIIFVLILFGVSLLPPERPEFKGRGGEGTMSAIRDVVANPHARLLLLVLFIDSIGMGGIGVLTPFVIEYIVKAKEFVPYLLGGYMIAGLVGIPFWIVLARHFEKRRLLLWSMVAGAIGYGMVIFVGEGDWVLMAVSAVIAGISGSCVNTVGYTLKSEIVDFDEYESGQRKEGAYFAAWSFMNKLAAGIMIGVVGLALEGSGFVPNQPDQTALVNQTMLGLMGGMPLVFYSLGALLISRFSLTEAEHARIRIALDLRNASEPSNR